MEETYITMVDISNYIHQKIEINYNEVKNLLPEKYQAQFNTSGKICIDEREILEKILKKNFVYVPVAYIQRIYIYNKI